MTGVNGDDRDGRGPGGSGAPGDATESIQVSELETTSLKKKRSSIVPPGKAIDRVRPSGDALAIPTTEFTSRDLSAMRSRRRAKQCVLTVIDGPGLGRSFTLSPSKRNFVVGRGPDADFRIVDDTVSRGHARFYADPDPERLLVHVSDLGSTNGTFVNGDRIDDAVLYPGDKVHLGDVILRFDLLDEFDMEYQDRLSEKIAAADVDPLTGLLTKGFYLRELPDLVTGWQEVGEPFCLIVVDLDHFKRVNDQHGHDAGDRVLSRSAEVIREQLRSHDIAMRYGGEEFVIVLPGAALADARPIADRLRAGVEAEDMTDVAPALAMTASLGLAEGRNGESAEELFKRADAALYRAKQDGRNRVVADA